MIDRSSGVPLYRQIKQIVAAELDDASPDAPVATDDELVQRFGVSRATVRQAIGELVAEGRVYRARSKGTFALPRAIERPDTVKTGGLIAFLTEQGREPVSQVTDVARVTPPDVVREALHLGANESVLRFVRRVVVDSHAISIAEVYLRSPEGFLPTAAELEEAGSGLALLERTSGFVLNHAEHHVWADSAEQLEADGLDVAVGAPILVLESVISTADGTPTVWRRLVDRAQEMKHVFHTTSDPRRSA